MSVVVQDTVAMLALTKVFQDRNKGMGSPHGGFHEKGDELASSGGENTRSGNV